MLTLTKQFGYSGVMTSFVWMFIASFQQLRRKIVEEQTINSLVQLHYDAFADAKAHVCTFILQNVRIKGKKSSFIRLSDFPGVENQGPKTLQAIREKDCGWFFVASQDEFARIPGSPIAYWIRNAKPFDGPRIGNEFVSGGRTKTHGNEQFVRLWWELDIASQDWAPYAMGGEFRKYSGNLLQVVNWSDEARSVYESYGGLYPEEFWHKEGITWGKITSARVGFREKPAAAHYDSGAGAIFTSEFVCDRVVLGFLNSPIVDLYIKALNPTVNTTVNDVLALPLPARAQFPSVDEQVHKCVSACRTDWDSYERSRDFQALPFLSLLANPASSLESGYSAWTRKNYDTIAEMKRFEEGNNRLFIDAYDLADELVPDVPLEQITLTVNPAYRYGGKLTEEDLRTRFRQDTMAELVSFAIGCMMGRYSLDAPGLIYAHSGNIGFDASRYTKFPADADGIVPTTDELWFEDDTAQRIREFLLAVWGADSLEQNMAFLADNLGRKASESPEETIRRYLADKFFKDHLQTYKKRPIYWLFSSGKQGAFQALVYLHRYNAGTLSRLRAEYVIPLTGKMQGRIEQLERDVTTANSTAARNRANKQLESLHKKHLELLAYDEQLRHYADQRIELDLDDGVKVNYGKFGDLLAEVKTVVGKQDEE